MGASIEGELVGQSRRERFSAVERRLGRVTNVLDELIKVPGSSTRVGIDPLIGLIPFVGDAVAAIFGGWVIAEAARFGIPRIVLARMVVNLLVDLAIGVIPFIGDIYDFVSQSNTRNLDLFRRHALDPEASTQGQQAFFAGLVLMVIGVLWLLAAAFGAVLSWLGTTIG